MGTVLVVSAHPSEGSFTNAWAEASVAAAQAAGHEVLRSDLCAMGFDAVERAAHYGASSSGVFDPLKAQEAAGQAGDLPLEVAGEVAKVQAADRIILHFPIWWFAPPAVIKGWCDRVLVQGVLHSVDQRFDAGMCRDMSVLFCVSTGASAAECGQDGKEGDLALQLWPLAQTFRYLGMQVLEPVAVHGVHGYHEGADEAALQAQLGQLIAAQTDVIAAWDNQPRIAFNSDGDFDDAGRLKPGAPSYSAFVRHA
ncbi:General stress protein 14 [Shimia sp. SK013]|uniref:NAD(P)H-dependent oxidoreductase n=1 Tax=Shimia sp. SK013 TaxID=1389006 RepID=UPI0006B4B4F5|nr:NAD(P)H-dependent oxidoreductase [Shimia sp. SK013]KPA20958.1 General stress protein 14 [Shimia sp. SK013]